MIFCRVVSNWRASCATGALAKLTQDFRPLFGAQLVRMINAQMTLHGYQIHAETGTAVHYAQVWVLRQVEAPSP
jgi:hypothetical protein